MTEATYLLDFSARAQRALLEFIAKGAVEIAQFDAAAIDQAAAWMAKHEDLPWTSPTRRWSSWPSLSAPRRFFTLDRRDFGIYRLGRRKLTLLPRAR